MWPQAALRLLLALALLAHLVVLPAMAIGASAMGPASKHSAVIDQVPEYDASAIATAKAAANDPAEPSPHAPDLADANVCNEYADSEPALPAPPLDDCGRRTDPAALPDIALGAPLRPQGPDPRPPLA
ncbi:hypothetical protein [Lysobacter enzymogenes]|uniref:hypothetical protein n=1 Tax=Lysobacter enzymogenes TaxID=69 RepID=UPI001A963AB7|nr:hypothetical protein [Lysobacter enzymogenes]QQP97599.1 hypothetical protein JHW38_06155 [Lysobacter enzymogenes]